MTLSPTRQRPAGNTAPHASATQPGARRGLLPDAWIRQGRPAWWAELLFIGVGYALYDMSRNAVPGHRGAALHRAQSMLDLERHLHLSFELAINHAADKVTWLIVGMNYFYATLNFAVLIAVMIWLYLRRPGHYRAARTALATTTFTALIGFYLFPLAPPRFLTADGFIDTVVAHHTWGSWATSSVTDVSNQYAAMPSIHIAWSTWGAVVLYRLATSRTARLLGLLYPAATLAVIISTANHFEADAIAGLLIVALGFTVQRLLTGRAALARR